MQLGVRERSLWATSAVLAALVCGCPRQSALSDPGSASTKEGHADPNSELGENTPGLDAVMKAGAVTLVPQRTTAGHVFVDAVLHANDRDIVLHRSAWPTGVCESFDHQWVPLDEPHGLVDLRIHCRLGSTFWTVATEAALLRIRGGAGDALEVEPIWIGYEEQGGAMDECFERSGEIRYERIDGTVWVVRTTAVEHVMPKSGRRRVSAENCRAEAVTTTRRKLWVAPAP
jgi:hypothetical protein